MGRPRRVNTIVQVRHASQTLAEFVGFAFRFCQGFRLFRRQRLGLTPYFPETVQRVGIGHA